MMNNKISPPIVVNRTPLRPTKPNSRAEVKEIFSDVLKKELHPNTPAVKLSKHAWDRLHSRGIELSPQDIKELSLAVDSAQQKGARESLIVYKDNAFIVSVRNRTVITAMDGASRTNNVFTNIDSAVIWNHGAGPQGGSS